MNAGVASRPLCGYSEHALLRMAERYECELSPELAHDILEQIASGRALIQSRGTGHSTEIREKWLVQINHRLVSVVVARPRDVIVTVLPANRSSKPLLRKVRIGRPARRSYRIQQEDMDF